MSDLQQQSTEALDWLGTNGPKMLEGAIRIAIIILIALVMRAVLRKIIDRLTSGSKEGKKPGLLKPLRERAPQALGSMVSERREQRAKTIGSVLKSIVTILVFGIAFIQILTELGMNVAPILTSAGILGVAIGFGAQNLVEDFLSGMFMMLEDQYGVGDVVDLGPAIGTVEAVALRTTTIRDTNGTVWYVRNGEILRVGNKSQGFAVAVADLPLGHNADIAQATEIAQRVAAEVAEDPEVAEHLIEAPEVVGIEKLGPEGLTFRVQARTSPGQQFGVQRALITALSEAFERAGLPRPVA